MKRLAILSVVLLVLLAGCSWSTVEEFYQRTPQTSTATGSGLYTQELEQERQGSSERPFPVGPADIFGGD